MKLQNRKKVHDAGAVAKKASEPRPTNHPARSTKKNFPIAGIGASAGGLEAFTALLKHLPPDIGMGFVLVQHLDPQHESALPQLLARVTPLPVREISNNLRVEPNHVYVIPPNTVLAIVQGVLKLHPRQPSRTPTRSINAFFESLAQDQRERAIGVVLSGTASDGTIGLEAIKAEGGITFAQDASARYDSMPRCAVAAGCVDFVLKPEDIARELARIAKHPYVAGQLHEPLSPQDSRASATAHEDDHQPLPSGGHETPPTGAEAARSQAAAAAPTTKENGFKKILLLLRNHSGVDFSLYKSTTIQRRITRRMVLSKHRNLGAYAAFLRGNAKELDALYSDVLISVTSFFRNPEAFDILKRHIFPKLLQQRGDDLIRVWILGCSTGQEAYSVAMTYVESAEKVSRARKLQVFATDLNEALLDKARHALYAKSLIQDISPERLRRFFIEEQGGYRVAKPLREMVVFARQNLITDPPFSRIDLISCRNLLIYLDPTLQKQAIPAFHYALKPGGFLFLGASESISPFADLFHPAHKKHKIYIKKLAPAQPLHLPLKKHPAEPPPTGRKPAPQTRLRAAEAPEGFHTELNAQREADRVTVNQFAPPGVLINTELQILQFRGPTSAFLQPPAAGKATFDILKMAREGLMLPLRAAINKARKENKTVRKERVDVEESGNRRIINIEVIPLKNLRERCFLILFEDAEKRVLQKQTQETKKPQRLKKQIPSLSSLPSVKTSSLAGRRVAHLERELSETRDYLQSIQEQHEAAHEELQASNEEVQSANEELQSINEELETSKEELESANEELTTVNEEMASRNAELDRLNADLTNFQASTKLPLLLLGRDFTIRRFSPPAEKIFDLLPGDIGRPLSALRHHLVFPEPGELADWTPTPGRSHEFARQQHDAAPFPLEELVRQVIDTVQEQEREACDTQGRWYSLRVRPYLTVDNKVDGAVLLLIDITSIKLTERQVVLACDFAEAIIRTTRDPLVVLLADLTVKRANDAFYETFKTPPEQTEGHFIFDLGNQQWNIPKLRTLLEDILPRHSFFNDFEVSHDFPHIGRRTMLLNARRLNRDDGTPQMILLTIEDVTERQRASKATSQLASIVESSDDAIISKDLDGIITSWNQGAERLFGYSATEAIGQPVTILMPPDRINEEPGILQRIRRGESIEHYETVRQCKNGVRIDVSLTVSPIRNDQGQVIGASKIVRDITERKRTEESLRQAQAQLADRAGHLEQAVTERTAELTQTNKQLEAFIYSVAHDLRAPLRAMQGFSFMLLKETREALSQTGQDYAHRISKSAQFLDAMLIDMLAYSRISQQRLELVTVDLKVVLASVLSRLEQDIQEKNARVENLDAWPVVLAQQSILEQVLVNLISNALKFVRSGAPPKIRLWAETLPSGSSNSQLSTLNPQLVRVCVEDNGIGIAPEHQDQIFRLFTRLHGERYPGTGIGLAIVRRGVERMGGKVGVESTPGQGSRFWLDLQTPTPP